jgi:hypothetical protein
MSKYRRLPISAEAIKVSHQEKEHSGQSLLIQVSGWRLTAEVSNTRNWPTNRNETIKPTAILL